MTKKLFNLLLVVTMLAIVVPNVAAAPPAQGNGQDYVVVKDDWLSKLADKYLGNQLAYPAIVALSNAKAATDKSYATIENPDVIEVGWKLYIPSAEEATAFMTKYNQPGTAGQKGEFHGAFPYQVPPTGHWNSFVTNGIPNGIAIYWDLLEMPFARYNWASATWTYYMAEKAEVNTADNTVVVSLRKGANWSDGKPFTAKDVVATFDVGRLFNWPVFNYVDTVTAKDDSTVVFHMATPSSVVLRFILTQHVCSAATYGALADKVGALLQAGKTKDSEEWKALVQEATNYRPDKLIVSGPYNVDPTSITEAQLTMNAVPTAWLANTVKFSKIILYNGETPVVTPLVLAGDVDYATHGFPPATEKAFIEQGIRILRPPIYTGPALFFNNDVYPLDKKEVRQAMTYVIKRDENGTVSLGDSGKAVKYMAGFSDSLVPNWIPAADVAALNTYAYDETKATDLLTGIGFKKGSDGVWVDDKGKPLAFELLVPAEFADWSAAAENAAQQLNKFGFKITVRGIQFQQEVTEVRSGKFQIAIRSWGAANPHPYFSYVNDLYIDNYVQSTEGKGQNFPMMQKLADGTEVDLQQLINSSVDGLDENAQKAKIGTVAKVFNDLLPIVPLWERYGNNVALDTRVGGWPPDGDPRYQNAVYGDNFVVMMILDGTLYAK
jgi:peptide/nickel transport system substrate-binding protein